MIENFLVDLLTNMGAALVIVPFVRDLIAVRNGWPRWDARAASVVGLTLLAVATALRGEWALCAASAALAIFEAAQWWKRRRRKRRTLAALGAKGKARIAAMVTALRERARPRPVLRPQRGAA